MDITGLTRESGLDENEEDKQSQLKVCVWDRSNLIVDFKRNCETLLSQLNQSCMSMLF